MVSKIVIGMGVKLYVNLETVLLNNIFVMSIFTTKRQCRLSVLQHLMRLQFDTHLSQRRLDLTNESCVYVSKLHICLLFNRHLCTAHDRIYPLKSTVRCSLCTFSVLFTVVSFMLINICSIIGNIFCCLQTLFCIYVLYYRV